MVSPASYPVHCVFGFLASFLLFAFCLFMGGGCFVFPEEVVPYVVVDSVCLSSGSFYVAILSPL